MRKISRKEKGLRKINSRGRIQVGKGNRTSQQQQRQRKNPKYTTKENRVYRGNKKEDKLDKGKAGPWHNIMDQVWADAHIAIDQKIVDKWKAKGQCTRCTLTNHGWKHCEKEIRVCTMQRKSFKLPGG